MTPRPERSPERSQVRPRTVWTVGLHALALLALVLTVRASRTVLSWVLIALFFALALWPAVAWLQRKGMKKGLAVALVSLGTLAVVAGMVTSLVPMLVEQGRALVQAGPELVGRVRDHAWVQWADGRFGLLGRVQAAASEVAQGAAGRAVGVATGLLGGLVALITIGVLTLFMLLVGGDVYRAGLAWLRPERRAHVHGLLVRMRGVVGRYVLGTLVIAVVAGVVTSVALALLGVPYWLALGVAMVLTSLLPYIGSILGGVLVVGTTFATAGTRAGVICAVIFLAYQQLEGNVLQPLVQRRTMNMNPLLTALAMLVGTSLAGFLGTLLAVPVAGAVQVVLQDALARRQARWGEGPAARGDGSGEVLLRPPVGREAEGPHAPH